mgnify:CR=1 FL=1
MNTFTDSVLTALHLITSLDPALWRIVGRSLAVSATACLIGYGLGVLLGAWLAVGRFAGRGAVLLLLNTLLALPSVLSKLLGALCLLACYGVGPYAYYQLKRYQHDHYGFAQLQTHWRATFPQVMKVFMRTGLFTSAGVSAASCSFSAAMASRWPWAVQTPVG